MRDMRDDAFIVKKSHIRKSYWFERFEIITSYTKYIFGMRKIWWINQYNFCYYL